MDVAQERRLVEAGVERLERQLLGDDRVDREEVAQRRTLIGGAERGPLDDGIGLVAADAALSTRATSTRLLAWRPRPRAMFSRMRSDRTTSPSIRPVIRTSM